MANAPQITANSPAAQVLKPGYRRWTNSSPATWLCLVLLALPVLILHSPALRHNFVSDDWYILWDQANQGYAGKLFWLGWGYVRPIGVLTWKLGYHLFGINPLPFYLFALLLQLGNTWLVYSIVTRWLSVRLYGLVAGLIFCTYYLGWEPTLWLSSCFFDVQSAFFMLLTFRLFLELQPKLKPENKNNSPSQALASASSLVSQNPATSFRFWTLWLFITACYFLAAFSKETGLLLLPICLVWDVWQGYLQRRGWLRTSALFGAMFFVGVLWLVAHYWPGTKVTVGDTMHLDQLPKNIFYNLEGLFLFPISPFGFSAWDLLKHELKFGLWLLPAIVAFLTGLTLAWRNRSFSFRIISLRLKQTPALQMLVIGLVWTAISSLATVILDYESLRFLYVPHIGATLVLVGILALVVQSVQSLELPKIYRWLVYGGLAYVVGFLSLAGMLNFGPSRDLYAKSSAFTSQLTALAQIQLQAGATDLVLVNMPRFIEASDGSHANLFFDQLNPKLVLYLELGLSRDHVQVLRTADLPELGWDVVGDKVAPAQLPTASPTRSVIVITRLGPDSYQFNVQRG